MAEKSEKVTIDNSRKIRTLKRAENMAVIARDYTVNRIKSIVDLSTHVDNPSILPHFLTAAGDLNSLWETFLVNNQNVLDALLDSDLCDEFSTTLESEIRLLHTAAIAVADKYKLSSEGSIGSQDGTQGGSNKVNGASGSSGSRLPEIPLPTYNGELAG